MNKGSFVAVSDFHSNRWPLDEKIPYYLNEYDVIYILGDATDRGNDKNGRVLNGEGGVKLLIDIMDLSKKNPGRVIYIPGNHDEFLYNYAAHKNTLIGQEMRDNLSFNHGLNTIKDIDNLEKTNPAKFYELINWLGSLPIQRTHLYKGESYSLAHAFFNQNIYRENPNFSLKDLYDIQNGVYGLDNPYSEIIWYRKMNTYNFENSYNPADVPADTTVIIGHTPIQFREGVNLDLKNSKGGTTKVICVDGGIAYQTTNDVMLKYISGSRDAIGTVALQHEVTNYRTEEISYTSEELIAFKKAVLATMKKHGVFQVEWAITEKIYNNRKDWFETFSKPERFEIEKIDIEKIKKIIESYSKPGENNLGVLVKNFINQIINEYKVQPREERVNKIELIRKSLEILDKIATAEEQSIIVIHKNQKYTLRDYVINVMPYFYIDNDLNIKSKGNVIGFSTFINNILVKYRNNKTLRQLREERLKLEKEKILEELNPNNFENGKIR